MILGKDYTEEDWEGTFGIDHVQEGKTYTVVNGLWDFKVLSVYAETVVVSYAYGNLVLNKKSARTDDPLWVKEADY